MCVAIIERGHFDVVHSCYREHIALEDEKGVKGYDHIDFNCHHIVRTPNEI